MEMAGTTIKEALRDHAMELAEQVWPAKPVEPERELTEGSPWHVVVTEPLQETLAAAGLIGYRFAAYLPTFAKKQRQNYLKFRTVRKPMFPGYVFARFDSARDPWQRLYATRGVRGLLMVGDLPAVIGEAHIEHIKVKEAQLNGEKLVFNVKVGDTVEIDDPLWIGQLAKIETLDAAGRLTVLLSLFGREVRLKTSVGRVRQA